VVIEVGYVSRYEKFLKFLVLLGVRSA
jgi:hypothetical protein